MNPLQIKYNSQRDNKPFKRLLGYAQCGYTAACMMLSAFIPKASFDSFVAMMIRRMEPAYGQADLAARILDRVPWARGRRLGMFGDSYVVACNHILQEFKTKASIVWRPTGGTVEELEAAIDSGSPAMLSTMITSSGHYICVVGYDRDHWICHDPYGDGYRGYRKHHDGAYVKYPRAWLETRARRSDPNKRGLRFMYIKRNR